MTLTVTSRSSVEQTGSAPPPRRVGLLPHPQYPASRALAAEIAEQLHGWGMETCVAYLDDESTHARLREQDLLVVLGGDGALLRAGHFAGPLGLPLLGVNLGSLGFLSEVQPGEWRAVLTRVAAGEYWLENRMMLHAEVRRGAEALGEYELLNEVVVGRGEFPRPVRLRTSVDDAHVTRLLADGLIVATPTGSTAYALAVGGPILAPELRNMLVIPIAPHLSFDRALVLAEESAVTIAVHSDTPARFTGDGQYQVTLAQGDCVVVRAGPHACRFVRVRDRGYFFRTLMRRMGLESLDHE